MLNNILVEKRLKNGNLCRSVPTSRYFMGGSTIPPPHIISFLILKIFKGKGKLKSQHNYY